MKMGWKLLNILMSCSLDMEYVQGRRPFDLGVKGNATSTFVKAKTTVGY